MPIGDNRNVVTDTNASVLDPLYQAQSPAQPRPQDILSGIGQGLGIQEAISTMTGGTPEEQQMFALGAVPMLLAPEARAVEGAIPFVSKLPKYAEEVFSGGGATVHKLQKPGRWPTYVATSPEGEAYQFKDFNKAKYWAEKPPVQRPDLPASPMESPPWEEPIRAYHGSPHDFEQFDISKIGTGEGAQTYGHGLYFAEEPAVSETYKSTRYTVGGQPFSFENPRHLAAQAIDNYGDRDHAIANLFVKHQRDPSDDLTASTLALLQSGKEIPKLEGKPGRMYEVNIKANPEHFLDWDKAMHEQSPEVLKKMEVDTSYLEKKAKENPDSWEASQLNYVRNKRGQHVWEQLVRGQGETGQDFNPAAAMKALKEQGIPGVRYLDQRSRHVNDMMETAKNALSKLPEGHAGRQAWEDRLKELSKVKPTYNYVVFDDKLVDITKKIGLAGLIAGGASNWSPDKAEAGEVVPLPMYPGQGDVNRQFIENLKAQTRKNNPGVDPARIDRAFDKYFGGGAQVLPIKPGG